MERKEILRDLLLLLLMSLQTLTFNAFIVEAEDSSVTKIYIDPIRSIAKPGESIAININVADVADLCAWEIRFQWDYAILDLANIAEGPLLKEIGSTYFVYTSWPPGDALIGCFLFPFPDPGCGAGGNGTLVTISFLVLMGGVDVFELPTTRLYDSGMQEISHTVEEGLFYVGEGPIQDAIDAANPGDTIVVPAGTYYGTVVVYKNQLTLIGEDRLTTVIDTGWGGAVYIIASNVSVMDFTITGGRVGVDVLGYPALVISDGNKVTGNIIRNVVGSGVRLRDSSWNHISGNTMTHDFWYWYGVDVYESSFNTVSKNNITNGVAGMSFYLSSNNIISCNYIANNHNGIILTNSSHNRIFHNNFVENQEHASSFDSPDNSWDNGYPSCGNYWSNYGDVDLYTGANQDIAGSDGIWDHPYNIDTDNQDRYPLVKPWTTSPTERLQQLIGTIETWNLPRGTQSALTIKLNDAAHLLEIGNKNGASHKLKEFIEHVEALKGKKLTSGQAEYLISESLRIIDLIKE